MGPSPADTSLQTLPTSPSTRGNDSCLIVRETIQKSLMHKAITITCSHFLFNAYLSSEYSEHNLKRNPLILDTMLNGIWTNMVALIGKTVNYNPPPPSMSHNLSP